MTPDQYCQEKAAASGSSFYYSFLFLPPPRRRAITALYAFCREVDDVVDECSDPMLAAATLGWWCGEIEALYAGEPTHPAMLALRPAISEYGIEKTLLLEIVAGMKMDLDISRYPDFSALARYCHCVAGVVGLLAARIFGYRNEQTAEYAHELGLAFQLTNIIRDIGEDARRNRIYLPEDELRRFGVSESQIFEARHDDNFRRLIEFQIDRAEEHYQRALDKLPASDRKAQRPGLIMAAIYRTLLREIRRDGCRVLTHRTALTPLRKLWIAARAWVREG